MNGLTRLSRKIFVITSIFMLRSARSTWRHPKITLSVFFVAMIASFYFMPRTLFVFTTEDMPGAGIATVDELKEVKARYDDGTSSILLLNPPPQAKNFSPEDLCRIRQWYSIQRVITPDLIRSFSTFDLKMAFIASSGNRQFRNLLDLNCDEKKFSSDRDQSAALITKAPFALAHSTNAQEDLFFIFTFNEPEDKKFGSFNPKILDPMREDLTDSLLPQLAPGTSAHWVGPADMQWAIRHGFKRMPFINLTMILIFVLGLRFFYGSWKPGLYFAGCLTLSCIYIIGGKALTASPFDMLSTGLMLMIGIASLEDLVFICSEQMHGLSWKKAMIRVMVPSFYTSLTTVIGFFSLLESKIEIIRRFGLWAGIGASLEFLMFFILVPCMLDLFGKKKKPGESPQWVDPRRSRGLPSLNRIKGKALPPRFAKLSLLAIPLGFVAYFGININESPHKVFPESTPFHQDLTRLAESRKWTSQAWVLFDQPLSQPEVEAKIEQIIKNDSQKLIVNYESPTRLKRWLNQTNLVDAAEAERIFSLSRGKEQFIDSDGKTRVMIYINDITVFAVRKLQADVAKVCSAGECHLGGEVVAYAEFATEVPKTLLESMMTGMILVAVTLAFLAMAANRTASIVPLLLSAFWGPMMVVCLIGFSGIVMDFNKCTVAGILVGLAGDNSVHYLFGGGKAGLMEGVDRRADGSIITTLLMIAGCSVYLLSYFTPPRIFGAILGLGLIIALFGDLWILKSLLEKDEAATS